MTRHLVILATAIGIGTPTSSADAHHSHPYFYDQCTTVTVEGRVETVDFKDPHSVIVVRQDDGTAYTVDWNPMSRLTDNGIIGPAKAALVTGARVVVTGSPIKSAAQIREHFPDFKNEVNPRTIDPRQIRTATDSFSWALRPGAGTPPDCKGK